MINLKHKNDLITLDLRTKQIRYLTDYENQGEIEFINLSNDDVSGYSYLYKEDKNIFYKTLQEDIKSFLDKEISITNLVEVE